MYLQISSLVSITEWLGRISKYRSRIGSIVMNGNPFTRGHRYLIEQSAAKVEQDGEVISASRVRILLEKRDFDTIAKIVLRTTS